MPLDAATTDLDLTERQLYLDRRRAAGRRWETVPEKNFDLQLWHVRVPLVQLGAPLTDRGPCQTIACALGWLGELGHDGWRIVSGRPYHPLVREAPCEVPLSWQTSEESYRTYDAAARYFGLQPVIAHCVFGDVAWYHMVRGVVGRLLALGDVTAALLDAPVTLARDRVTYPQTEPSVVTLLTGVSVSLDLGA